MQDSKPQAFAFDVGGQKFRAVVKSTSQGTRIVGIVVDVDPAADVVAREPIPKVRVRSGDEHLGEDGLLKSPVRVPRDGVQVYPSEVDPENV